MSWSDEDDVITRANDTQMGLGASVWSSDLDEAARIAKQLEAGSVWVNAHIEVSPIVPFGDISRVELEANGERAD